MDEFDWIEWRKGGLGSSDCPVYMGVSPYKTPLELWKERTGRSTPQDTSYVMQKGKDIEQKIRLMYELLYDADFKAYNIIHQEYPFMRASLDGFNEECKRPIELKLVGKDSFLLSETEKKLPDHYYAQVMHQLFVTGAPESHYVAYNEGFDRIVVIPVQPDEAYFEEMFQKAKAFWECIQTDTPPPITDRDYLEVTDGQLKEFFLRMRSYKQGKDEKSFKQVKEKIALIAPHPKLEFEDMRLSITERSVRLTFKKQL